MDECWSNRIPNLIDLCMWQRNRSASRRQSAPSPQLLERVALPLEKGVGEDKVQHEDGDEGDDDGAGGGLADALGAARGGEAPRAADL
jgi:hypothetical protein